MNESMHTIEDAARCLPELVERVHSKGEAALLFKAGKPLARIVPIPTNGQGTGDLIAFLRTWRAEHPDADDQFAEAIEESRSAVRQPHDPWQ